MAIENGIIVTFYDEPIHNKAQSKKLGYPVFDTMTMIDKRVPNSINHQPRPMREQDKTEYPISWQAYVTGKEPVESGLPVEQWPQLTMSEVAVLRSCSVRTVEQLAELADSGLHRLGPGGRDMKNRAQKFLTESASVVEMRAENDLLREEIASLRQQIGDLSEKPKRKKLKVSSA